MRVRSALARTALPAKSLLLIYLLIAPVDAWAKFVATGKISASVCSGFIIQSCKFVDIVAVRAKNGQLYEVAKIYNSVSEFEPSKSQCNIRLKTGSTAADMAAALRRPDFMIKVSSGKLEKVDPEYLTFSCREVR